MALRPVGINDYAVAGLVELPTTSTSTQYVGVQGRLTLVDGSTLDDPELNVRQKQAFDGELSALRVNVPHNSGVSGSDVTVTLMKNGTATSLAVTVEGDDGTGVFQNNDDVVYFAAGDELSYRVATTHDAGDAIEIGSIVVQVKAPN